MIRPTKGLVMADSVETQTVQQNLQANRRCSLQRLACKEAFGQGRGRCSGPLIRAVGAKWSPNSSAWKRSRSCYVDCLGLKTLLLALSSRLVYLYCTFPRTENIPYDLFVQQKQADFSNTKTRHAADCRAEDSSICVHTKRAANYWCSFMQVLHPRPR